MATDSFDRMRPFEDHVSDAEAFLAFRVAGVHLAVPAEKVDEVCSREEPTRVPRAPKHVIGLITLRGQAVPVLDLQQFLDLSSKKMLDEETAFGRVVIVSAVNMRVGLDCDRVFGCVEVGAQQLQKPTVTQGTRLRDFAFAEVDRDGRLVTILDLDKVLQAAKVRK